ncbi:MAG: hypothetical protein WC666_01460 [Candidatus Paceibacterota bacterium]|jgi:hypothetical protein
MKRETIPIFGYEEFATCNTKIFPLEAVLTGLCNMIKIYQNNPTFLIAEKIHRATRLVWFSLLEKYFENPFEVCEDKTSDIERIMNDALNVIKSSPSLKNRKYNDALKVFSENIDLRLKLIILLKKEGAQAVNCELRNLTVRRPSTVIKTAIENIERKQRVVKVKIQVSRRDRAYSRFANQVVGSETF